MCDFYHAAAEEKDRGWKSDGGKFEVPDGLCIDFKDIGGNEYAILQMTRPYVLPKELQKAQRSDETWFVIKVATGMAQMFRKLD